jgi:hypothetical protein
MASVAGGGYTHKDKNAWWSGILYSEESGKAWQVVYDA